VLPIIINPKFYLGILLLEENKKSSERAISVFRLVISVGRVMSLIIEFGQSMLFATYELPFMITLLSLGLIYTVGSPVVVPVN